MTGIKCSFLLAVAGLSAMAGTAAATPTVWEDYIPIDTYMTQGTVVEVLHDITDDGFVPGVDELESFTLTIELRDDHEGGLLTRFIDIFIPEIAFVDLPGSDGDQYFLASRDDAVLTVGIHALVVLNTTGMMEVTIADWYGDFELGSSTLAATSVGTVSTTGGLTPVPEPHAAFVFMLGALVVGREVRTASARR